MRGRIAVTGANGFIGENVVRYLSGAGWKVQAIVRPGRRCTVPDGVELIAAPLVAAELVRVAAGTDVIVHAAGRTRAATARQLQIANVEVTREAVHAAAELGARLIHISSQAAAGPGTPERPRSEDDPPSPLTAYGRSKLAAEEVVRTSHRLRWTIVRPALVYGPADRNTLPLFQLARRGIALGAARSPAPAYTFVHVDDVARGIEAAATTRTAERQVFFEALGKCASDAFVPRLSELITKAGLFRGPNEEERFSAALALAWLGTPKALEVLNRELQSKKEQVRRSIETALETVRNAALGKGAKGPADDDAPAQESGPAEGTP